MNLPLLHTTVCVCVRVVLLPYIVLYRIPFQNIRGLFEKKIVPTMALPLDEQA